MATPSLLKPKRERLKGQRLRPKSLQTPSTVPDVQSPTYETDTVGGLLRMILLEVWQREVRVSSNLARAQAHFVAMAASLGLITTQIGRSTYAGSWQITGKGLRMIKETE